MILTTNQDTVGGRGMILREERIGGQRLILGDCLQVMKELGRFDAVVTDPPYGIAADENPVRGSKKHEKKGWDKYRPHKDIFDLIINMSEEKIIWGGNYFTDFLPPTMRWLAWDKQQGDFSLADFELAWTSQNKAARIFRMSRGKANTDGKQHPTQKPIALMEWCLGFLPAAKTVLDPFMGSGSTLVACQRMGRHGTGIELDPDYFDVACRRVEEAYRQPDMFVAPPEPAKQEAMGL